ncbi:MAG TPA: NTP transferase domain-containing protein [bacterium]|nr:NTP transferase domain-containing protein [bacterium]
MEKIAALILAAGKGTRMNEGLASPIPKVMFEANGEPLIYHSVSNVRKAGVEKVVLVVGYRREMIEEYFGEEVEYAVQEEQLGTGHATAQAKPNLEGKSEAVLVCYGDMPLFKPETIKKLIDKFLNPPAGGEKPTVAMLSVMFDDPNFWAYGRIFRDEKGEVVGIIEQKDCKPEELEIRECNPGFYIFDAKWLWENIDKLDPNNAQHEYYLTDMIVEARDQGKRIIAMPVSEESEALGVNTVEQLKQAEEILRTRNC